VCLSSCYRSCSPTSGFVARNISDIGGQQGSNGLQKLLCLKQGSVGLGMTDMGRAAIISDASQVRQCTGDSADVGSVLIWLISLLDDACELILIDEQAYHRIMHGRGP
jgi:hypothetical protein